MAPIYLDPLNNGRDTPPTGNAVPGSLSTGCLPEARVSIAGSRSSSRTCPTGRRCAMRSTSRPRDPATRGADARRGDLADAITAWTADARRTPPRSSCRTPGSPPAGVRQRRHRARSAAPCARGKRRDRPSGSRRDRVLPVAAPHDEDARIRPPARARLGEHTWKCCGVVDLDARDVLGFEDADAVWQAPPPPSPSSSPEVSGRHRGGGVRRRRIEEAAQRAADLGFDHLDSSAGESTGSTPRARQFGGADRRSHRGFEVSAVHVDGAIRASWRRPLRRDGRAVPPAPGRSARARAPQRGGRHRATSRRWSPQCRDCDSRWTAASWRRRVGTRFRCWATPTTCNCGRPRRDARNCTPTRVATSTSPRCSPSSSGSTTPG